MARQQRLAAALMAGMLLAAPAFAEDTTTGGANLPDATTGTQTDSAVQPASPDAAPTAGTATPDGKAALAAIEGTAESARHIGTISAVSGIHVVKLSDFTGPDRMALTAAAEKNQSAIAGLRSTLGSSDALAARLKESSVDVKSVVAATIEADGAVTIYVN